MLTTGSKLFFGATLIALVGAIVYGIGSDWELAGVMMLMSLAIVGAFLGAVALALRDADRPVVAAGAAISEPATSPNSVWPVLAAATAATTALGAALDRRIFYVGVALLVGVAIEWVIQGWADRASADPAYNNALRGKLMHPIEFPVIGAIAVAFVIFLFSRLMLSLREVGAVAAFVTIGAVILIAAVLLSGRAQVSRNAVGVVVAAGALVLLVAGIAGLAQGERHVSVEADKTSNAVAAKSNIAARIRFADGAPDTGQIYLSKSAESAILFTNESSDTAKLVIEALAPQKQKDGSSVDATTTFETPAIGKGKTTFITLRLVRSGTFTFAIETEDGRQLGTGKVIVP